MISGGLIASMAVLVGIFVIDLIFQYIAWLKQDRSNEGIDVEMPGWRRDYHWSIVLCADLWCKILVEFPLKGMTWLFCREESLPTTR